MIFKKAGFNVMWGGGGVFHVRSDNSIAGFTVRTGFCGSRAAAGHAACVRACIITRRECRVMSES
eukprot:scaffold244_cov172-Amphora_coffeaeformis.AAC.12